MRLTTIRFDVAELLRAPRIPTPDQSLARYQSGAVWSAGAELSAGVRVDPTTGRSPRVDEYAARAGMKPGRAWCGFFVSFAYDEAARAEGGRFVGNSSFHSFEKARSFFQYRNYVDASGKENSRLDRLRDAHAEEGSVRRYFVLAGSEGARRAELSRRPHERFEPADLPLRPGDTALFSRGHLGLVESYDPRTGKLVTIEGNAEGARVRRSSYDLSDPKDRTRFEGFGRPAQGDFLPRR